MMSDFQKNSMALLLAFSALAISGIMVPVTACVAGGERGPHYSEYLAARGEEFRGIEGLWFISSANFPGKLEFHGEGHRWVGRIWIDAFSRWEELTDIFFDPRTGEVRFYRPTFGVPYSGTLSGHHMVGTCIYQGTTYSWEATREVTRRGPVEYLPSIEGRWFINNANEPGKLEFFREGHRWAGRIWIDVFSRWEELTDISFDPRTGEVRFNRPTYSAPYSGVLSGNQIAGTFIYQGGTYSWEARRH
jgi:hypothetical protein